MYRCPGCGELYLSQREADLCSPRECWMEDYGIETVDPNGYYVSDLHAMLMA